MFPNLYLVILNWNQKQVTIECLESLFNAGILPEQIILVDNGSCDGSAEFFKSKFTDRLHLIENHRNLGFAQASNQGIQYALQQGAEWIMLLNNDTVVAPDFFNNIYQAHTSHPEYAILGPLILNHAKPEKIWFLGGHQVFGTLLTINIPRKYKLKNLPAILPVDFLSGCAMVIHRKIIEQVGLFNPHLIAYAEEVELCWKARQAGYKLAAVTTARMWHKVSLTADFEKPKFRYLRIRNQIRFYRQYSKGFHYFILFIFTSLRTLFIIVVDVLVRKQLQLIKPAAYGWWDGWFSSDESWLTYESR